MLILFQGWKLFRYSSSLGNEFSWSSILPPNIYSVSSIPEKYRRNICRNLLFILAGLILAERNIHSPTAIMLLRKKLPYTCFVGAFILNNKTFYKIYLGRCSSQNPQEPWVGRHQHEGDGLGRGAGRHRPEVGRPVHAGPRPQEECRWLRSSLVEGRGIMTMTKTMAVNVNSCNLHCTVPTLI